MRDAYASWDIEAQDWVLASSYDPAVCDNCCGEATYKYVDHSMVRCCDACGGQFNLEMLVRLDSGDRACRYCNEEEQPAG